METLAVKFKAIIHHLFFSLPHIHWGRQKYAPDFHIYSKSTQHDNSICTVSVCVHLQYVYLGENGPNSFFFFLILLLRGFKQSVHVTVRSVRR